MSDQWVHGTESYRYATRDDLSAFADLLADPDVGRWLWFTPISHEALDAYFGPLLDMQANVLSRGGMPHTAIFVVESLEGQFLGHGAAVEVEQSPRGFEIGFQLEREAWGRGVGTRLGQFLCAYAVECCNAYRLEGGCLAGNHGSAALLRKLGLELEGTRPGYRLKGRVRHTELCFGREVEHLDLAAIRRVAEVTGLV